MKQTATAKRVDLHLEGVIYRLIETVREKTAALLPPTVESRTIGEGNVIQPFEIKLPKRQVAVVAGSRCVNGTFNRNDKVRIVRGPSREQVYEGESFTSFDPSPCHLQLHNEFVESGGAESQAKLAC